MKYQGMTLEEDGGKYYFHDSALAATHDPKGPDPARRETWMKKVGARESRQHWVGDQVLGHEVPSAERFKWLDHRELFLTGPTGRGRVLTFTSQPYDVTLESFKKMEKWAKERGLTVTISIEDAWWFPGGAPLIIWKRASK